MKIYMKKENILKKKKNKGNEHMRVSGYRAMANRKAQGSLPRPHQHRFLKAARPACRWQKQMRQIKSEPGPRQGDCVTTSALGRARCMGL